MNALFLFTFLQTLNLTVNCSFHLTLTAHKQLDHSFFHKPNTQQKALKIPTIICWRKTGHIILIICDLKHNVIPLYFAKTRHHDDTKPRWPNLRQLA